MRRLNWILAAAALVALAFVSLVSTSDSAQANPDSIAVCCAWNGNLADGDLTYKISGGDETVQGIVGDAVEEWETVAGLTLTPVTGSTKPNVDIKFKKGGGMIQGQALRSFDDQGFVKSVKINISGKAFGDPNNADTVAQIGKHEFGHALGLGHADFEGDLMSTTVSAGTGVISTCDKEGVLAANHWKLADGVSEPHHPHVDSVSCGAVTGASTVSITRPDDGAAFDSGATIVFQGTASDAEDGSLTASLAWTSDIDGPIGTGGTVSTTLSDGSHIITASVTDSDTNTGSASITVVVGLQTILVQSIECAVSGPWLFYRITVVADEVGGAPVAGATVSGTRLDPGGTTFTFNGDTNEDGQITFRSRRPARGDHLITVEDVVEPGFQFDPALGESSKTCKV